MCCEHCAPELIKSIRHPKVVIHITQTGLLPALPDPIPFYQRF